MKFSLQSHWLLNKEKKIQSTIDLNQIFVTLCVSFYNAFLYIIGDTTIYYNFLFIYLLYIP